jgi:hypothetical protein
MQRLLAVSLACAVFPFYAMERPQAVCIIDMLTPIYDKQTSTFQELGALLRYPSEVFKKTDIVIIDTSISNDKHIPNEIDVSRQGKLKSLSCDNINDIARGFACYYPCTKKSFLHNDFYGTDVGTIPIDRNMISSRKSYQHLMMERNAIFIEALQRKAIKKKNKDMQSDLNETMYGYDGMINSIDIPLDETINLEKVEKL